MELYGAAIVAVNVSAPRTIPRQLAAHLTVFCWNLTGVSILVYLFHGVSLGLVASLFPLGL